MHTHYRVRTSYSANTIHLFHVTNPHHDHALSAVTSFFSNAALPPLIIPVLLAATRPTLAPGGVNLETVEGCPICY